jgi:hypothetical protein
MILALLIPRKHKVEQQAAQEADGTAEAMVEHLKTRWKRRPLAG